MYRVDKIVLQALRLAGIMTIVPKFFGLEVEFVQAAQVGADPKIVGLIGKNRPDEISTQAVAILRVVFECGKAIGDTIKIKPRASCKIA